MRCCLLIAVVLVGSGCATEKHGTKLCQRLLGGRSAPEEGDYVRETGPTRGRPPPEGVRVVRSRAPGRSATGFLPENCLQRPTAGAKGDGGNRAFSLCCVVAGWRACRPAIGS